MNLGCQSEMQSTDPKHLRPVLVNYMHECQVAKGVPPTAAYSSTMYLMAGVLSVGFLCNGAVQPICHPSARPMSRVLRSQP